MDNFFPLFSLPTFVQSSLCYPLPSHLSKAPVEVPGHHLNDDDEVTEEGHHAVTRDAGKSLADEKEVHGVPELHPSGSGACRWPACSCPPSCSFQRPA